MVLACCHPLIIVLIVRILFIHPELFKSLLSLSSGVHQFRFIHSQFAVIILRSYRCLVQVIFNRLVLSSSHVSKYPKVSSFILQFFPVICAFATFNFNSYGGSFKSSLSLLSYQFIRSFQILPVVPSRPSQVCAISILILSTRISSMPNPLLVINLNW